MKCGECRGSGKEAIFYQELGMSSEQPICKNCNGTGVLTEGQEIEYKLRAMEIHDYMSISNHCRVLRVVGGWIYEYAGTVENVITAVFVKEVKR